MRNDRVQEEFAGAALVSHFQKLMVIAVASFVGVHAATGNGPIVVPTTQPDWLSAALSTQSELVSDPPIDAAPSSPLDAAVLSEELEQLRRRLAVLEQQITTKPAGEGSGVGGGREMQSASAGKKSRADAIAPSGGKWTTRLGGHFQTDYITWAAGDPAITDAENYFSFRRLRLLAEGTGYGQFDFRLQLTLEPGSGSTNSIYATPDVKDADLSMNDIPLIGRARIGNFFVPFSLEQVTNDTNNIFNERSIPTETVFAASREQ